MAISINYGYTTPSSAKNLSIYDVDYTDWAKTSEKKADQQVTVEAVNITSPIDRQALTRTWRQKVSNVYAQSSVNSIYQSPLKEGVRLGHMIETTVKITDSDNPGQPIYVPLACTVSFVTGLNPNITADSLLEILKMNLGTMFPTGSVTTNQLAAWLAGSLTNLDESSED